MIIHCLHSCRTGACADVFHMLCLPHVPLLQAQARDAAMQVQAAVLTAQNIHLRRELASGWAAADSNMIQVRSPAACRTACMCSMSVCPFAAFKR